MQVCTRGCNGSAGKAIRREQRVDVVDETLRHRCESGGALPRLGAARRRLVALVGNLRELTCHAVTRLEQQLFEARLRSTVSIQPALGEQARRAAGMVFPRGRWVEQAWRAAGMGQPRGRWIEVS